MTALDVSLFRPIAIGHARTPFKTVADIPKGPGTQHVASGTLELLPEFEEGLLDIEGFSHLYVIWVFTHSEGYELTGHPPGETQPHGVFATRSPYRPNPLALTTVELLRRDGPRLDVRGVDMLDGTPILDIKPWSSTIPEEKLKFGWLEKRMAK
jgi:tRNA-Thr(GGU) m(6)t(6)A37 methyltransferase TsaA